MELIFLSVGVGLLMGLALVLAFALEKEGITDGMYRVFAGVGFVAYFIATVYCLGASGL